MDEDAAKMTWRQLRAEVIRLREAIRLHRDQKLDDRCWMDDYVLYESLPEGGGLADLRLLPVDVMLANCRRYVDCRATTLTPEEALDLYRKGQSSHANGHNAVCDK